MILVHFVLLLMMGLVRHWSNMTSLNDLGVFDQAVWGTLHGDWFLNSGVLSNISKNNIAINLQANWLGFHFNPFLVAFVPLYALWPAAEWFVIAQAVALSIAAWPIFLLARRVHESEQVGVLWVIIYLCNPFLLNAAAWDFHPVVLAVPLIATALLAVEMKNFRMLITCCLLLLLIQEQCGITVAGFGWLWAIRTRRWKTGSLLVVLGCLHAAIVLGVVMPSLSPNGIHPLISGKVSRYSWLGSSLGAILGNILLHPLQFISTIITMPSMITYIMALTIPFLGMFLAAPFWLLPGIADLAANVLSAVPMPREFISYHSVTLVPILTVASIYGVRKFASRFAGNFAPRITLYVLCYTLVLGYLSSPFPFPGCLNYWKPTHLRFAPDPVLHKVRAVISDSASVSAQANVGTHFSQRKQVYLFPDRASTADTIVLWLDTPTDSHLPQDPGIIGTTAHHLQMNPEEYLAAIESLLRNHEFGVVLWEAPWLVLSRGAANGEENHAVQERLHQLHEAWKPPGKYNTIDNIKGEKVSFQND